MVDAVMGIVKMAFKTEKLFPAVIMGGALILSFFTDLNVAIILLLSGITGWVAMRIRSRRIRPIKEEDV